MKERTLAIIKPDGVSRGLTGQILIRLEGAGLRVAAMKMLQMTKAQAKGFYKVHQGKTFYESLTDFMSSSPCVVMVLEGADAVKRYRELIGATNYKEAAEGTIRREFATDVEKNVVHGSDSKETASTEISYFFNELEIMKN